MTDQLGQMVYEVARALRITVSGKATGGSTTTLIDTGATSLKEFGGKADDFWNGGTAGIIKSTDGAAPQWEFSEISDYVQSTQTITLQDALTAAIEANDRYWVAKKTAPLNDIIEAINDVLQEFQVVTEDITSITTAADQTEYNLPAVAALDLRQVFIARQSGDSNDNQWEKISSWVVQRTAIGTADLLVFDYQPETGMLLKLVYVAPHPLMYDYDDKLSEAINRKYVVLEAASRILEEWVLKDPRTELQNHWNIIRDRLGKIDTTWMNKVTPQADVKLNVRFSNRRRRWIGDKDRFR